MDTDETITTTPTRKRARFVTFFRRLAVVLVAVIVLASLSRAIVTAMETRKQVSTLTTNTRALQKQQAETQTQLNTTQETLLSSKKNLQALRTGMATAQLERGYQNNDWLLLKARYYLELSTINAKWSNDAPTTVALLHEADALLAILHDPRTTPIRQAIAEERAEWQALTPIDITGLLSQLNASMQTMDRLTLKTIPSFSPPSPPSSESTQKTATTWRDQLQASLHQLEHLVVIQHHDEAIQPLITPAYESMIRENIRLNLQEAQWAVIQHNEAVYQLALNQALESMKRVFDIKNPMTQSLMRQLTVMQDIQLHQAKPAIGKSLLLLNQWIESIPNRTPELPLAGENP